MKRARKQREIFDISTAPEWLSDEAKAEWSNTPEGVRQWAVRRDAELNRGIQKYKQLSEQHGWIRRFAALAESRGVTLEQMLQAYNEIERRLLADPIEGLRHVFSIYGDGRPFEEFVKNDLLPAMYAAQMQQEPQSEAAHARPTSAHWKPAFWRRSPARHGRGA
jgi:hypothetical protein